MRVVPNYQETSTQKIELDLRSGSKDMVVPSIIHMILAHEKLFFCGKPPGRPLDPELVRDVSQNFAPLINPG